MSKTLRISRRELATAALLAVPVQAQTSEPTADLSNAKAQTRRNSEQLRKYAIPMATEPSFAFKP